MLDPEASIGLLGDGLCKWASGEDYANSAASMRKFVAFIRREGISGTVYARSVGALFGRSNPLVRDNIPDLKSVQAALLSAPRDLENNVSLAFAYVAEGKSKLALETIHNVELDGGASEGEGQIAIGLLYLLLGQFDEADRLFAMAEAISKK